MIKVTKENILSGNIRALSKAITLIESTKLEDQTKAQAILGEVLPYSGKALRVGITGVPGVGKSTFIEALGLYLVNSLGKKIAVLAVDPSSPKSGGSLLGDKTRMEELSKSESAFIRPTPTSGDLGGVAAKTKEAMVLCEAAGFDVIFVETVGVGQSEFEVSHLVDLSLLMMLPNAGDGLQGIKRGIIEMCDLMFINKSDGDFVDKANEAKLQYEASLSLLKNKAPVMTGSALKNVNIKETWDRLLKIYNDKKTSGEFDKARKVQNVEWFDKMFVQGLKKRINGQESLRALKESLMNEVFVGKKTALRAVDELLEQLFK